MPSCCAALQFTKDPTWADGLPKAVTVTQELRSSRSEHSKEQSRRASKPDQKETTWVNKKHLSIFNNMQKAKQFPRQ